MWALEGTSQWLAGVGRVMKAACVTVRPWRTGPIEVTGKKEIILTSSIPQTGAGDPWGGQGMGRTLVPRIWTTMERRWCVLRFAPP